MVFSSGPDGAASLCTLTACLRTQRKCMQRSWGCDGRDAERPEVEKRTSSAASAAAGTALSAAGLPLLLFTAAMKASRPAGSLGLNAKVDSRGLLSGSAAAWPSPAAPASALAAFMQAKVAPYTPPAPVKQSQRCRLSSVNAYPQVNTSRWQPQSDCLRLSWQFLICADCRVHQSCKIGRSYECLFI